MYKVSITNIYNIQYFNRLIKRLENFLGGVRNLKISNLLQGLEKVSLYELSYRMVVISYLYDIDSIITL